MAVAAIRLGLCLSYFERGGLQGAPGRAAWIGSDTQCHAVFGLSGATYVRNSRDPNSER